MTHPSSQKEHVFQAGDRIGKYYVVQKSLGQGGMGRVYKASHILTDQVVAIKLLAADLERDANLRKRFLQEARAMASFSHPNLVSLHTFLYEEGRFFLIMEHVDGRDLDGMFRRAKRNVPPGTALGGLSARAAVPIFSQALAGLSHAHQKGVLHRDLKPSNILVTREGAAKLIDFGLALIDGGVRLTLQGTHVGTTFYLAPEILRGLDATPQTDIYSMGVSLFEVVTGRLPFVGDTLAVQQAHIHTPAPDPRLLNPSIPPQLSAVILRSLEKDQYARFQTADEFRIALGPIGMPLPLVDCPICLYPHPRFEGVACPSCHREEICHYHITGAGGLCRPCVEQQQTPTAATPLAPPLPAKK